MRISLNSLDETIKRFERLSESLDKKSKKLCERLALIAGQEASVRFSSAVYDGDNDSHITVEETEKGYKVIASGRSVCFIEFGAGVYHNPAEPYPDPRPEGIVGIGEYGKGYGKRRGWVYENDSGERVFTRGNPAAMPMYYASEEIKRRIAEAVREVFFND